jgi:hypothetical protein
MHSRRGQHKGYYIMKLFPSLVSLFPSRYGCTEKKRRAYVWRCYVPSMIHVPYELYSDSSLSYLISHLHFTRIKGLSLGNVFSPPMFFLSFVPYIFYHVVSLFIEYFLVFVTYWYSYTSFFTSFERKEGAESETSEPRRWSSDHSIYIKGTARQVHLCRVGFVAKGLPQN